MAETKVGWVGIGVMGKSMCGHLLKAGYPGVAHHADKGEGRRAAGGGAAWCPTPKEVAQRSDIVFCMVGFPSEVEQVYFGDDGILAGARAGSLVCDMSTSDPSTGRPHPRGGRARSWRPWTRRCPAATSAPARRGLPSWWAERKQAFDRALPLFQKMGETIALMGGPGAGQHTKMANQIAIAGTMIGTIESLLYAKTAGPGHGCGDRHHRQGRRGLVVAEQPRQADRQGRLRPRLLHQALREGHGDRAAGSAAHEARAARALRSSTSSTFRRRPWAWRTSARRACSRSWRR